MTLTKINHSDLPAFQLSKGEVILKYCLKNEEYFLIFTEEFLPVEPAQTFIMAQTPPS